MYPFHRKRIVRNVEWTESENFACESARKRPSREIEYRAQRSSGALIERRQNVQNFHKLNQAAVDFSDALQSDRWAKRLDAAETALAQIAGGTRVAQDIAESGGESAVIVGIIDRERGIADDLSKSRSSAADHRTTTGHSFERRPAEALVQRRKNQCVGRSVKFP